MCKPSLSSEISTLRTSHTEEQTVLVVTWVVTADNVGGLNSTSLSTSTIQTKKCNPQFSSLPCSWSYKMKFIRHEQSAGTASSHFPFFLL